MHESLIYTDFVRVLPNSIGFTEMECMLTRTIRSKPISGNTQIAHIYRQFHILHRHNSGSGYGFATVTTRNVRRKSINVSLFSINWISALNQLHETRRISLLPYHCRYISSMFVCVRFFSLLLLLLLMLIRYTTHPHCAHVTRVNVYKIFGKRKIPWLCMFNNNNMAVFG